MLAFHSYWTAPGRVRSGAVALSDYDLVTMLLSALEWRRHNGQIRMVTDTPGARLFEALGLLSLWDAGLDTSLDTLTDIDPYLFWAAGKLYALSRMDCPCVMLDTDMVFWEPVSDKLDGKRVVVAHFEPLNDAVYPPPETVFHLAEDYAFPPNWDFSLFPANTAFLYMPERAFARTYTEAAFAFMRALRNRDVDPTVSMCFAEQRILPMCARASGQALDALLDAETVHTQRFVTHLWGHKRLLAASPGRCEAYCLQCVRRMLFDFPEQVSLFAGIERLRPYLIKLASVP